MSKYFSIKSRKIGKDYPVFIIAEAGVNHNGSMAVAKKMIDAAKEMGADAIKFQTFKTEEMVTKNALKAKYQKASNSGKSQYAMLRKLEFSESDFRKLFAYCQRKRIIFLSTPFDQQSAGFLCYLRMPAFKISSGDLTDIPLLKKIANFKKPIILSTGMSTLTEVKEAVRAIYLTDNKKLILLHCTSNYPARYRDVNLRAIRTLREEFDVPVGYSDHAEGIDASIAAVAMGARVIEKHFTLDKNSPGPDHSASLEPEEFGKMIESIRNVEEALGDGLKKPRQSEVEMRRIARKSIVAAVDLPKRSIIKREMLAMKRPGSGIAPKYLEQLIGKQVKRKVKKDQVLNWNLIS